MSQILHKHVFSTYNCTQKRPKISFKYMLHLHFQSKICPSAPMQFYKYSNLFTVIPNYNIFSQLHSKLVLECSNLDKFTPQFENFLKELLVMIVTFQKSSECVTVYSLNVIIFTDLALWAELV